jgi:hypothetical protein
MKYEILHVEFTIFHDLMDNGIYCELYILDGNGIVEMLPIIGDETLSY